MNNVKDVYKGLKDTYTSAENQYVDKLRQFRAIFESFAKMFVPNSQQKMLGQILKELFDNLRAYMDYDRLSAIETNSKELLNILNDTVHKYDAIVTSEKLLSCYQQLLRIIWDLTGQQPDNQSLILAGIQRYWVAEGLNNEQRAAVLDESQLINVDAGPGTGKTHLLVRKVLKYLNEDKNRKIVALSFTNAAATQLREKLINYVDNHKSRKISLENTKASTIHSFCYNLLLEYNKSKGSSFNYEILDDSDIEPLAEELANEWNESKNIGIIINILRDGPRQEYSVLSDKVRKYKEKYGYIKIEEILDLFINTFSDSQKTNNWLGGVVDCLLVDESQDLTKKILKIIDIIYKSNKSLKIFFVGDPRQNIFRFNGGSYAYLQNWLENLTPSQHTLIRTYRCPDNILTLVNSLSFLDCKNKNFMSDPSTSQGKTVYYELKDVNTEAFFIVEMICQLKCFSDICVISPILSYLEPVGKLLNERKIPYIVKGGERIMKLEIKLVIHCLRIITSKNETSINRVSRVINNIQESQFYSWLENMHDKYNKEDNFNVYDAVSEIIEVLSKHLKSAEIETLKLFVEKSKKYTDIRKLLYDCATHKFDSFSIFYEQTFKEPSTASISDSGVVTLSTIHSAKGLEWKNVFLAGVYSKNLPSYKCYQNEELIEGTSLLNDEKKKYYVAVTRSSKNLILTYPKYISRHGHIEEVNKSPFVSIEPKKYP